MKQGFKKFGYPKNSHYIQKCQMNNIQCIGGQYLKMVATKVEKHRNHKPYTYKKTKMLSLTTNIYCTHDNMDQVLERKE